jgi:AN1-type zinc finger protein 5/6
MSEHKTKLKCFNCKKKVGLINFNCRCEHIYCQKCRLPETHNCELLNEFKSLGKERLKNNLQKIVAEKIIKI